MNDPLALADAVRKACEEAAVQAYEDAGLRGLCHEGRWECAVQAIRRLDLGPLRSGLRDDPGERSAPEDPARPSTPQ